MRIVRPAAFALLALLAAAPSRPWADDAAAPREIAPAEVEAAQAVLGAVPPGEAALLNALRYLLQPEFEAELLTGRHTRRCSLAPFEKPDHGAFGVPERVRLWAVLECGMPVSPALEAQLQRMLDQPAGESAGLAGLAVEMLAVRAALRNPDVRRTEVLISRAGALHAASLMLPDACGAKSPLVQGDYISPRWYALQLWRAALTRAAADCVPTLKDKQWQEDLRALLRGWLPECGFVPRKNGFNDVTEETACNLAAFCALRLAAEAPKGLLPTSLLRDVERRLKDLPAILARLQHKAPERALGPARILMLASLPATAAPEGTAPAEWHSTLLAAALEGQAAAGIAPGQSQGTELALVEPSASRGEREALQTALFAIALRGGLFSSLPAPLSGKSLAEIGRRMHAQAMLQASRARNESSDFAGRVKGAIADGCEFVAEQQDETGAFRGVHQGRPGNTALCLLALLHGDFDRDSKAVQRGLARLLQEQNSRFRCSYDIALMLMFFQAYHEREQREAGMLTADAPAAFEQARQRVRTTLPDTHRAMVDQLTKDLQACAVGDDGYGYTPLATTSSNSAHGHTDNSCSQYAILGLKAASLLGAPVNARAFHDEARRLVKTYWKSSLPTVEYVHEVDQREGTDDQRKTRSRKQSPKKGNIHPGGWAYATSQREGASLQMTAAGVSSLTICMDELKLRGMLDDSLAFDIGLAIRGARAHITGSYLTPERLSGQLESVNSDGMGTYYDLYAVERACVLAGIRKLDDDRDWYRIGAEALLDTQQDDGSWVNTRQQRPEAAPPLVNFCMAILFLKQASMPVITEHKKREPQPPAEEPRRPITPGPEDKGK